MEGYEAETYGDRIADWYDSLYGDLDTGAATETLVNLAAGGPVLELGIGTGRLALPLANRGMAVDGIDASPAMADLLRKKPGAEELEITIGDLADFELGKSYRLIFVAFNTLFNLRSQEEQVSCFVAVARHLADHGAFVVEAFVPDLSRFSRNQEISTSEVETDKVIIHAAQHDPVRQVVSSQQVMITEGGIRLFPVLARYAYPSELDLMARLAGLRLESRWADWNHSPFVAESGQHVSVYRPTR